MNDTEKLVKLLDDFNRNLSAVAGNERYVIWDDHVELAKYLVANDVTPVVHAHWVYNYGYWYCSNCNYGVAAHNNTPYCPRCGAKMDGGSN